MAIKPLKNCPFCQIRLDPDWSYCDNMLCSSKFVQSVMGSGDATIYRWGFNIGDYNLVSQFYASNSEKLGPNIFHQVYAMTGPNFSPIFESNEPFVPDFSDMAKLESKIKMMIVFS